MIGAERAGDGDAIRALTTAAFEPTPHGSGTEAAIVDALRDAGALALSLVALEGDEIVGHVALSPVTINGRDRSWVGLGPISVAPARQRQGVGSALIATALDRLRAMGAAGCVLLGNPEYYSRFGFKADPALTYAGAPAPYFQSLVLVGPPARGAVRYHAAFDTT